MSGFVRNGRDQPLIIPLDANGAPDLAAKRVPYGRISKFAGLTDDTHNLSVWQQRVVARGLAIRADLLARVVAVNATYVNPLDNQQAKAAMKAIIGEAFIAGGGNDASERGTYLHNLTEYVDRGEPCPPGTSQQDIERMWEYESKLKEAGIVPVVIEAGVVNDPLKVAGTLDRVFILPDGAAVVADYKTGAHDPNYPSKVCAQVRTYSTSKRYDYETGERSELYPNLDPTRGLLIHQPDKAGEGCEIYELNLEAADPVLEAGVKVIAARAIPKRHFLKPFN